MTRRQDTPRNGRRAARPAGGPPLKSELLYPGMRVGLFGGSFDPAHEGHLHVAETAMNRLGLHRVWFLVSPQNPLKERAGTGRYEQRLAETRALAGRPFFVVSDIERRLHSAYTIDTVRALRARWPGVKFVWLMGADNLAGFHRWRGWEEIAAALPMAVVARGGTGVRGRLGRAARRFAQARIPDHAAAALADRPPPAWTYIAAPLHPQSSSAIRARAG